MLAFNEWPAHGNVLVSDLSHQEPPPRCLYSLDTYWGPKALLGGVIVAFFGAYHLTAGWDKVPSSNVVVL